jgi:hypothetical protein
VEGELRVDLQTIYNSLDYRLNLLSSGGGNAPTGQFTTGWLGLELAHGDPGLFPNKFSQVGIKSDSSGVFWFVYAEPGVTCLSGHTIDAYTCQGDVNQFVSPGTFSYVELVTYLAGFWIARVYDINGTAHDVATISSGSGRAYRADATFEEGYRGVDPYYAGYYCFKHPQYMLQGTGFQEWATSVGSGADSYIYPTDLDGINTFCPQHYGASPYYGGDSRAWYAGTIVGYCQWLLFPSSVTYQPDIRTVNGWTSVVTVLNNTSSSARVDVAFFDSLGTLCDLSNLSLPGLSTQSFAGCGGISAVVNADRDVSVVTTRKRSPAPYSSGAYVGMGSAPGLSNTFHTSIGFYVPVALHQKTTASGISNSDIVVQNANTAAMNVTITMVPYPGSGLSGYTKTIYNLAPEVSSTYNLSDLSTEWYGSAVVSASGQIAVLSDLLAGSNSIQTFNAFPAEGLGTTWFDSLFLSRVSGLTGTSSTPISVQNLSGSTIPVGGIQLTCLSNPANTVYPPIITASNTTSVASTASYSFNPVVDTTTFPTGWYGTCKVTSGSYNVVTLMQIRYVGQDNADAFQAHSASGTGHNAFFPIIQKRLSDGSATSISVQNLSTSSTANVTFHYYADSSCSGCSNVTMTYSIPPAGAQYANHRLSGLGTGLPDGWFGSLQVTSTNNQPIDGYAQLTNINNPSGDTFMAHGAVTRP